MNNKVRELYRNFCKGVIKRRTIGDVFYDNLEMNIKREKNRKRMIDKLKREEQWKNLEQ